MKRLSISCLCVALVAAFSLSTAHAKKSKGTLFDQLTSGKTKNQKYRNAYLLATMSKLAYQPKNKTGYRDTTKHNVKTKGKIQVGGKVNPKRFEAFGLELCNPEMPYWTTKKNDKGVKIHDAQAYLVHNDTSVILAFRGTAEKADWKTNTDAIAHHKLNAKKYGKGVKVHGGWLDATKLANKQLGLNAEVRKCLKKGGKKRKLHVTGHSLGGAMATLWTFMYRRDGKVQPSRLYTYGAPSVGNKEFVKQFNKQTGKGFKAFSWVNENDPVTGITWSLGFRRTGTPQWITCKGMLPKRNCKDTEIKVQTKMNARLAGSAAQHDMTKYMSRVLKLSPKKVRNHLKELGAGKNVNAMVRCAYKGKCKKKSEKSEKAKKGKKKKGKKKGKKKKGKKKSKKK